MTKPREFWITFQPYEKDPLGPCVNILKYVATFDHEHGVHVREVMPIDWDKIWESIPDVDPENFDKIQQLVEKQLAGEE